MYPRHCQNNILHGKKKKKKLYSGSKQGGGGHFGVIATLLSYLQLKEFNVKNYSKAF